MKLKFDNQGFSLVEILVAVGLLSILAIGGATLFSNQMKGSRSVDSMAGIRENVEEIKLLLSDSVLCRTNVTTASNVSTTSFNSTNATTLNPARINVSKLNRLNSTSTALDLNSVIFQTNQNIPGSTSIRISEAQVLIESPVGSVPTQRTGKLSLKYSRSNVYGSPDIVRVIPLEIIISDVSAAATIVNCKSLGGSLIAATPSSDGCDLSTPHPARIRSGSFLNPQARDNSTGLFVSTIEDKSVVDFVNASNENEFLGRGLCLDGQFVPILDAPVGGSDDDGGSDGDGSGGE